MVWEKFGRTCLREHWSLKVSVVIRGGLDGEGGRGEGSYPWRQAPILWKKLQFTLSCSVP
jgi:hypothetical protein